VRRRLVSHDHFDQNDSIVAIPIIIIRTSVVIILIRSVIVIATEIVITKCAAAADNLEPVIVLLARQFRGTSPALVLCKAQFAIIGVILNTKVTIVDSLR